MIIINSLENNVGIIAACIPTLKPLFGPTSSWLRSKYPSKKGAKDSGDDVVHLHEKPKMIDPQWV